jgi:hypothetical protein
VFLLGLSRVRVRLNRVRVRVRVESCYATGNKNNKR